MGRTDIAAVVLLVVVCAVITDAQEGRGLVRDSSMHGGKSAHDVVIARCLTEHGTRGLPEQMDSALLVLGHVVLPDGAPARGVEVLFKLPGGNAVPPTKADSEGLFAVCLDKTRRQSAMQIMAKAADGTSALMSQTLTDPLSTVTVKFTSMPQVLDLPPAAAPLTVHGIAFDSLHGAPLGGAFITLLPGGRTTTSAVRGEFAFDSVVPGPHSLAVQHDVLDAIGMSAVSTRFTVTDAIDTVRISVPSFARLWTMACRTSSSAAEQGIIFGTVRTVGGTKTQAGASVRGSWVTTSEDDNHVTEQQWHMDVESDATGGYALCGVPLSASVQLRATTDSAATGLIDLDPLDKERIARRDLMLGGPMTSDSTARGVVIGRVSDDRGPLRDARVLADGVSEVRTGADGRFILRGVPSGTRQVDVRAIGLAPTTSIVDVVARDTARVEIHLGRMTVLDSVRVHGRVNARQLLVTQFEERRRQGIGYFKDSTQIARSNTLTNVFADMPVTVRTLRGGALAFSMKDCTLAPIWIDRVEIDPMFVSMALGNLRPEDIAAIEVYRGGDAPAEFRRKPGDKPPCAVVIWTKRGWP